MTIKKKLKINGREYVMKREIKVLDKIKKVLSSLVEFLRNF